MNEKKARIEILEPVFINGQPADVGDVVEIDLDDASHMCSNGRARLTKKDVAAAKKAKE